MDRLAGDGAEIPVGVIVGGIAIKKPVGDDLVDVLALPIVEVLDNEGKGGGDRDRFKLSRVRLRVGSVNIGGEMIAVGNLEVILNSYP